MSTIVNRFILVPTTAMALSAAILVGSSLAQNAAPSTGTAPPSPPTTAKVAATKDWHSVRVEARIKELRQKLKITATQEPLWNDFAGTMRENAQAVDAVLSERSANIHSMNAVADLESYQKLADAHANGMKRLIPAFQALYDSMSDSQKQNADRVFGQFERRKERHAAK
jgi:hypothetical protein